MPVGWASAAATNILNAVFNATAYSVAEVHAQLHIGDPGAAGVLNPATETTRQQVSMGIAAGGTITSDADVTWTTVAATETYSHVSLWTAAVGGSFVTSGTITAAEVDAGDDFVLPTGDIDASVPIATT